MKTAKRTNDIVAICRRAELLTAVDYVNGASPIIELSAGEKGIILRAATPTIDLSRMMTADVQRPGRAALPVHELRRVLRCVPDDVVRLAVNGNASIIGVASEHRIALATEVV